MNTETEEYKGVRGDTATSWADIARQQVEDKRYEIEQQQRDEIIANNAALAQYRDIEDKANAEMGAFRQQQGIAFMGAVDSARRNGGVVSKSLYPSMSQAFGLAQNGAQITGMALDENGNMIVDFSRSNGKTSQPGRFAISPVQGLQLADRAKLGESAMPYRQATYDFVKKHAGLTDNQMSAYGIQNPSGLIVTSRTASNPSGMISARGLRPQERVPSRISTFASDGRGGMTRSIYDGATGQTVEENYGTRNPNGEKRWMSGEEAAAANIAQSASRRYVPQRGDTAEEKMILEQQKNDNRIALEKEKAAQRERLANLMSEQRAKNAAAANNEKDKKFDRAKYDKLKERADQLDHEINGRKFNYTTKTWVDGGTKPTAEETQKLTARRNNILAMMDSMLGGGEQNAQGTDNNGQPQTQKFNMFGLRQYSPAEASRAMFDAIGTANCNTKELQMIRNRLKRGEAMVDSDGIWIDNGNGFIVKYGQSGKDENGQTTYGVIAKVANTNNNTGDENGDGKQKFTGAGAKWRVK